MHHIESQKFSDVSILIRTLLKLDRKTITTYNLLVYMLKAKTQHFNTKQKLSMALNHAYGMGVSYSLTGYGKQIALDIRFQYIREDFLSQPSYIEEVKKIMDEILYHPVLDEETLKEAKYFLNTRLTRIEEDPDSLALKEALTILDDHHDISIPIQGFKDQIDKISLSEVKRLYDRLIETTKTIFVCGPLHPSIEQFLETIPQTSSLKNEMECIQEKSSRSIVLERKVSQTSIVQVYQTGISFDSPYYYPLLLMNSILGQGPISLLFEEVREKHSYCYSISSSLIRFDGALLISVGTSKKYIYDVLDLIQIQIERIKKGDFDEAILRIAKMDLLDLFNRQQDRPWSMIEQSFLDTLLDRKITKEQRKEIIRSITKEDIQKAAQNLSLISTAIVEEDENV